LTGAIVFMILQTTTASQMPASTICAARRVRHAEAALYAPANIGDAELADDCAGVGSG